MGHILILPTELLVSIFLILRDDSPATWLRVLSVCRRWYEVACAASPLWSRLSFDERCGADLFETFLRRSDSVKLELNLDIHAVTGDTILNIVQRHSAQLHTLAVIFSTPQTSLLQRHLEDHGFSRCITDLKLYCIAGDAPQIYLQPLALSSLQFLQATQVLPRPRPPTFNSVTRLELVQIWHVVHAEDGAPGQYDLLSAIRGFPALETLMLHDALPPCTQFDSTTVVQTTLPVLRNLEVNETIEDIKFFLHHVVLPESARVCIFARVADSAIWEVANGGVFLSILPENSGCSTTLPMVRHSSALRLFAGHTEDGALSLSGGSDAAVLSEDPAWSIVIPDCGDLLDESISTALEELSQVSAPSGLTHLEVHIAPRVFVFEVNWQAVLRPLHHVQKLVVGSKWAVEGLITALYQHQDLLPELQLLELCVEELRHETHAGPLPAPMADVPPRVIGTVVVVQADEKKVPYLEGTSVGSMLKAASYEFKHSICSACHVADSRIFERERSSDESGRSVERTVR
ncbi:hypothetical protein FKP32DRAFT_1587217 [Trametes sanguinea]|nr:hypothetical protein FKP32DRAFT_1587217 [Trametes sanguinea]